MCRPHAALSVLVAAAALGACSQGADGGDVTLRVYEGITICDREGCLDAAGNAVPGEGVSASAILSRAASGFDPGVYLFAGAARADGRYFELEVDVPTARTGATGVDAHYAEYDDGAPVYESQIGGGQVRLVLDDRADSPPAGRFDLQFEDGRGALRRVIGSFRHPDVPPLTDRPIVEQVDDDDRRVVYVEYEQTPDDWNLYADYGCGVETEPEPASEDSGGCEGDSGGDDSSDGGGCEGDSGGDAGGGGGGEGCEGDSGGGEGCEGDTGGGSGCEGGDDSCSVAPARSGGRLYGRLLPFVIIAVGRLKKRR
jgi:hypothetical protein